MTIFKILMNMSYGKIMSVPFFDFNSAPLDLKEEWVNSTREVIQSGQFIGGSKLKAFESAWADYLSVKYAVGVANGLDALKLALMALEIGPGCFVAVPSHTFIATWLAVSSVGATPVGVDCDSSGLMDLDILETFTSKLDAVIVVHMHGKMLDMTRLTTWTKINDVKVVEDCAQAHGASWAGKNAGTWGDVNAFSFYPTKNLGALGDAGIVVTDDSHLEQRVRSLGNYGAQTDNKYLYDYLGTNSRLDPLQASFLSINLRYLDEWNERRRQIAEMYLGATKSLGIRTLHNDPRTSVWHHFIVLADRRDAARLALLDKGVSTEIHYPRAAEEQFSEIASHQSSQPIKARELARETLSLPISQWMTFSQVEEVLEALSDSKVLRNFQSGT
jgi:dTDP-4-amino-4,6-dideoxygalactose transaminase